MTPQSAKNNAYYRARMLAIKEHSNDREDYSKSLKNGLVPNELLDEFELWVNARWGSKTDNDKPLSFTELTTFNTWYDMHPEKVCGKMKITTSLFMPITVIGTKQDVEKAITNGLMTEIKPQQVVVTKENQDYQEEFRQKIKNDFGFLMVNVDIQDSKDKVEETCSRLYSQLSNFAELIHKPKSFLSLNGNLSISIGAKTIQSGVLAHYTYDERLLSFRKCRGYLVEDIAHEWFHALDHYLSYAVLKTYPQKMVSSYILTTKIPDNKALAAIKNLVKILPDTHYYSSVKLTTDYTDLDQDYWLANWEMLARAFQRFIYLSSPIELAMTGGNKGGLFPKFDNNYAEPHFIDRKLEDNINELINNI